jgi:hypothetical protein
MASLWYVSNALLAIAVPAAWVISDRQRGFPVRFGQTLAAWVAAAGVGVGGLAVAWVALAPGRAFVSWVSTYAGGAAGPVAGAYGLEWSVRGIALALARAAYGSAGALADLSAVVDWRRDGRGAPLALGAIAAFLVAAMLMAWLAGGTLRESRAQGRVLPAFVMAGVWTLAVAAFGVMWNNSDDQFYFQLAVPAGMLIALAPRSVLRSTVATAALAVIAWNGWRFLHEQVFFPRSALVATLESELQDADIVVAPGMDQASQLLYFTPFRPASRRIIVADLADRYPPSEGLRILDERIGSALTSGRRVVAIDMFDVSAERLPWRGLRGRGYGLEIVQALLRARGAVAPVRVGSFTFTDLRGGPP